MSKMETMELNNTFVVLSGAGRMGRDFSTLTLLACFVTAVLIETNGWNDEKRTTLYGSDQAASVWTLCHSQLGAGGR